MFKTENNKLKPDQPSHINLTHKQLLWSMPIIVKKLSDYNTGNNKTFFLRKHFNEHFKYLLTDNDKKVYLYFFNASSYSICLHIKIHLKFISIINNFSKIRMLKLEFAKNMNVKNNKIWYSNSLVAFAFEMT